MGAAAALLTTPAVYAIQTLAVSVSGRSNDHDVQKMMAENMSPGVAAFALVSTVFLAPLVEESLFRGVLLGWLTRVFSPPIGPPPRPAEPAGSLGGRVPSCDDDPAPGSNPSESEPAPRVVGSPSAGPTRPNPICFPAIVATSLLFAGMHAPQWPAPVGIFFLSMVLGVVYQRTGSLLTAMVMHGVFNGCSTLLLLQGLMAQSIQRRQAGESPEIAPNCSRRFGRLIDVVVVVFLTFDDLDASGKSGAILRSRARKPLGFRGFHAGLGEVPATWNAKVGTTRLFSLDGP